MRSLDLMHDQEFITAWERKRENGFWRYFLIRAAIGVAIVMVLFGPGILI